MPSEETQFKKGNQAAKKSPRVVIKKFNQMLDNAKNDENILCWQDAVKSIGWRHSKVDYWINKLPVFGNLKKDIQQEIISRVNKKALINKFNSTASIWRMKQLGEKETQYQNLDHTTKGESINKIKGITFEEE